MADKTLASRLRDRVTIQRKNEVDNGAGGRRAPPGGPKWTDVDTVAAEITPLRGGEAIKHLVEHNRQLWRVTIRARSGLSTAMQLAWEDRILGTLTANIRSIALNDMRDGLVMTAESGVAG